MVFTLNKLDHKIVLFFFYLFGHVQIFFVIKTLVHNYSFHFLRELKDTRSVTMNIFRKKKKIFFKSFVKIELSYFFTINMFSTAESCMEQ